MAAASSPVEYLVHAPWVLVVFGATVLWRWQTKITELAKWRTQVDVQLKAHAKVLEKLDGDRANWFTKFNEVNETLHSIDKRLIRFEERANVVDAVTKLAEALKK